MAIRFSTGLRNAILGTASFKDTFQDGVIYLYSGVQPSSADDAVQGTLLGIVTQDAGAFTHGSATNGLEFGTPSSGVLDKAGAETWQFEAIASGTIGWFRLTGNANDDGTSSTTLPRVDGSVGRTGGDLNLTNTTVASGAVTTIDTFPVNLGANA